MPDRKRQQDAVAHSSSVDGVFEVVRTMGSTTWRMFVPTVGLLLIGSLLDGVFGTKPWLLLIGAVVGGLIAAYLIRRQLKGGA